MWSNLIWVSVRNMNVIDYFQNSFETAEGLQRYKPTDCLYSLINMLVVIVTSLEVLPNISWLGVPILRNQAIEMRISRDLGHTKQVTIMTTLSPDCYQGEAVIEADCSHLKDKRYLQCHPRVPCWEVNIWIGFFFLFHTISKYTINKQSYRTEGLATKLFCLK